MFTKNIGSPFEKKTIADVWERQNDELREATTSKIFAPIRINMFQLPKFFYKLILIMKDFPSLLFFRILSSHTVLSSYKIIMWNILFNI